MNEWLKLMLEEIRRKRQEDDEAVAEHRSRHERVGKSRPAAGKKGRRRGT